MANVYNFGWLFDPTTAPAVGDATALERFCKQLNMCLAMAKDCNYVATPGRAAGTWVANTPATSGMGILSITTKYRLPSDLVLLFVFILVLVLLVFRHGAPVRARGSA